MCMTNGSVNYRNMEKDNTSNAKCIFCGGDLSFDGQEMASHKSFNYDGDDEAMVHYFSCRKCGRDYEVLDPTKEVKKEGYAEYWNN